MSGGDSSSEPRDPASYRQPRKQVDPNAEPFNYGSTAGFTIADVAEFETVGRGIPNARADLLGATSINGRYYSADGRDVTDTAGGFLDYLRQRDKSKREHEQYVKEKEDRPGRSATILTPMSGPESKTLLGQSTNPSRTVLGG